MKNNYDIIIIGAGPAGLSFASSLEGSGLNLLIVEKSTKESIQKPKEDGREIALTHLSKNILKNLSCWDYLLNHGISEIKQAKVFDGNSSYSLDFNTKNLALGYLVPNNEIRQCLYDKAKTNSNNHFLYDTSAIDIKTDADGAYVTLNNGDIITAKLAIAADTRFSEMRSKMGIGTHKNDFARCAIVCRFSHEKSHNNTAFECFHYGRTLAILPMSDGQSSAVITIPNELKDELMNMDSKIFTADIEQRLHSKLGKMKLIGQRHCYPLVATHAKQFVKQRFALLGDAAVGMHPVTAHGFNLGLRGQNYLSKAIIKALSDNKDIGNDALLKRYETKHMLITKPIYLGTNGIVSFFTNDTKIFKVARKTIIHLANNFIPLKSIIVGSLTEKLPKLPKLLNLNKLLKSPFAK